MFTGAINGLSMMLLNVLRIPPGTTLRRANQSGPKSTDWLANSLENHDFINTIVDITADDVCIGNSPVFLAGDSLDIKSEFLKMRLDSLVGALNKIARWAAVDILKRGCSVYTFKTVVKEGELSEARLLPYLDSVYFFMTKDGDVEVLDAEGNKMDGALVFLNYTKESLITVGAEKSSAGYSIDLPGKIDTSQYMYSIVPVPVQLDHTESVARDLYNTERAIYNYRMQLARLVRFVSVDVGASQGDRNQEVIDVVDAGINANSMSLMSTMNAGMDFNDNIPIFAHRKGIGKPELTTDIPDFDIDKLADLDYTLSRLFLSTRFPKSYADFNTALSDTAVSLIRGDIRYSRMVDRARSLMEDTMNAWILASLPASLTRRLPRPVTFVKLVSLPNSEDDDVVEALSKLTDYTQTFYDFVNNSDSRDEALTKLSLIQTLLGNTANLHAVNQWFGEMEAYIDRKFPVEQETPESADASPEGAPEPSMHEDIPVGDEELDAFSAPGPEEAE